MLQDSPSISEQGTQSAGKDLQPWAEDGLPIEPVSRFSQVLSGEEFHRELERLSMSQWHWGKPQEVSFKPLKAHKGRCTFDVEVKTETGTHGVIAKAHSLDRSDLFEIMQAVVLSGFGPEADLAIPRPLAYLPSLHVLFEEKIRGTAAMDVFLRGNFDEQMATVKRCAIWLAHFHTAAPHVGDMSRLGRLPKTIQWWIEEVRSYGEPFASKVGLLSRELESAMPAPDSVKPCLGHGSYIPEHVYMDGGRTITIDLDEHNITDSAQDVAWFVVSLQRLGLKQGNSIQIHDRAVEAFVETYAAMSDAGALKHLQFFKAAEYLHRVHRDLYGRITPIPQWAEIMLDEGNRTL